MLSLPNYQFIFILMYLTKREGRVAVTASTGTCADTSYLLLSASQSCRTLLWPHTLQYTRLLCPSLSPEVCSDSCPLSWWCSLSISSSAASFSIRLQSFPASGSFQWVSSLHQVAKVLLIVILNSLSDNSKIYVISDSFWPHGLKHARLPCPLHSPRVCSDSCPLSWWCHPTISFSVTPPPPAPSLSQHQGLFQWVGSSHQVAKVLEFQHQSLQWIFRVDFLENLLFWSPCSPRDSQESSAPHFEIINYLVLSLLYGSTLTSLHDY